MLHSYQISILSMLLNALYTIIWYSAICMLLLKAGMAIKKIMKKL